MKKRLALLGLALIMVLGFVFGGAFAPLMTDWVAKATSVHSADVANYSIEHLPKKSFQVGDPVPFNQPRTDTGVYYTLTRQVSGRQIVVGVSHSTAGSAANSTLITGLAADHPGYGISRLIGDPDGFDKFTLEGSYTYNFYSKEEFEALAFLVVNSKPTGMVTNGKSFHSYNVTVTSTNFRIELPENDKDIYPNVAIPNNPITLPLPKHLYDMKGRDLLADEDDTDAVDARREAYLPELRKYIPSSLLENVPDKDLTEFFFENPTAAKFSALKTAFDANGAADKPALPMERQAVVAWIYRDMKLSIYGNAIREDVTGIEDAADRTFTPEYDGKNYYAEYSYENTYNNITALPFRTNDIVVEKPLYPSGINDNTAYTKILLNTIPEISFVPSESSFKIGSETTLPTATISINSDSEIQFDSTSTLTNYTYIAVRYRPKVANPTERQWRWIGIEKGSDGLAKTLDAGTLDNNPNIMRISDFTFTPEKVGDYQFWYYTTTIFGIGDETDIAADHKITFDGLKYIKHQPFANITIERDNLAPEIKWTVNYDYNPGDDYKPYYNNIYEHKDSPNLTTTNPSEAAMEIDTTTKEQKRKVKTFGEELKFEDAPSYAKMLPGSTTSSKSKIEKGKELVIPALLGTDNATASQKLDYQLYLYRYQDGVRSGDFIYWSSGFNGMDKNYNGVDGDGNRIWMHTEEFRIPFTEESFNNGNTDNENALLAAFRGSSVVGKYDLTIRACDEDNNLSSQYQYTFEVIEGELTLSRPKLSGLFRAGQNEYHEGDTMHFSAATFSDTYTDDRDIDVRYFLSLDEGKDVDRLLTNAAEGSKAVEIKEGETGMSVKDGAVSFELKRDNAAGLYVINTLEEVWQVGDWYPGGKDDGTSVQLTEGGDEDADGNFLDHDLIIDSSKNDGFLSFRVYAVARNFHAMQKGYEVGHTYSNGTEILDFSIAKISPANATPPNFMTAVYGTATIFDMNYGAAAVITDKFDGTYDTTNGAVGSESSWYTDETLRLEDEIAIPALRFFYPNGKGAYYSTITYSVTYGSQTRDVVSYTAQGKQLGGGWQGMLGEINAAGTLPALGTAQDANGKTIGTFTDLDDASLQEQYEASQRFFTPLGVGKHLITVKVANAGGNISVFVGSIMVVGIPQAQVRLLGERTSPMRVGESAQMPTVEITINNQKFETGILASNGSGFQGYIVTADEYPGLGKKARVGTFEIWMWSENGSERAASNDFIPLAVDTYRFTYNIVIKDNLEAPLRIIPMLDQAKGITLKEEWSISVEPINNADMSINLDRTSYLNFANNTANVLGAPLYDAPLGTSHVGEIGSYYDAAFTSDNEAYTALYDPREANVYNFFTDMLGSNAEGKTYEMSDLQLLGGLEPYYPAGTSNNSLPTHWQYGRIYVPNFSVALADKVNGLDADFVKKADPYVTVTKGGTKLLDTSTFDYDDADTLKQLDFDFSSTGIAWFRPQGLLVATYDDVTTGQNADWAIIHASNKADWEPAPTSQNNSLRVDGEYVITYHLEYMGITITKSYKIAMGDTQQPRITLEDKTDAKDKFTKTYKVGQKFTFNTGEIHITGPKNLEIYRFDNNLGQNYTGMNHWLADSQKNSNFSIAIMTYSGRYLSSPSVIYPNNPSKNIEGTEDDHNYKIIVNETDGTEEHSFTFVEPGTYRITINVKSPSGISGTKEYKLTVEEKKQPSVIAPGTVWGTILIILSIGLLLGVVIYFLRTGQQTKFTSAKAKPKRQQAKVKEDNDGGVV